LPLEPRHVAKFRKCHSSDIEKSGDRKNKAKKGGNYSDVLPLKAARRDRILGFKFELQMNPMPFHLESQWGATLNPHRGCAMDWDKTK